MESFDHPKLLMVPHFPPPSFKLDGGKCGTINNNVDYNVEGGGGKCETIDNTNVDLAL